jgi:hypothetical protein
MTQLMYQMNEKTLFSKNILCIWCLASNSQDHWFLNCPYRLAGYETVVMSTACDMLGMLSGHDR